MKAICRIFLKNSTSIEKPGISIEKPSILIEMARFSS